MNSERVTLQRRAGPLDAIQGVVHGVDPSSLETARKLVAGKFSDDERARESIERGTEAVEILGKLGMDADTLAAALLLRFLGEGAIDRAAIEKSIGAQVARLTQGRFVSPVLKISAKPQPRLCRRIVCGRCY
jgi:(p)ppGpp synthase/HD superfamily hydrolase